MTTFDEERREVRMSIEEALRQSPDDEDLMAACRHLLRLQPGRPYTFTLTDSSKMLCGS